MKKPVKIVLIAIPVIVIVLGVVMMLFLGNMIAAAVPPVLSEITGTNVVLESVSLNPLTGKGTIKGFIIGNPEGFKTESAFELGEVRIDIDLMSLLSDTIVIEEIYINAPKITYEMGMPSNIGQIQKNVEEFSGPPKEGEEPKEEEEEEDAGPGKKILIKHFLIENGKVSVSAKLLQGRAVTVPLPRIEKHDIGGGGDDGEGKSIGEVSKEIFTSVGGKVTEVAKKGFEDAKKLIGKGAEALGEGAKSVGKGAAEAGKGAVEAGKKAGKGAVDAVKGLFGGDKDKKE